MPAASANPLESVCLSGSNPADGLLMRSTFVFQRMCINYVRELQKLGFRKLQTKYFPFPALIRESLSAEYIPYSHPITMPLRIPLTIRSLNTHRAIHTTSSLCSADPDLPPVRRTAAEFGFKSNPGRVRDFSKLDISQSSKLHIRQHVDRELIEASPVSCPHLTRIGIDCQL